MKTTPYPEEWLIVGAGAVGLLWATRLTSSKRPSTLVYRSQNPGNIIYLNENGQITPHTIHPISLTALQESEQVFSQVLFCTKAFDLCDAYRQTQSALSEHANIFCLNNGMGSQQQLATLLLPTQTLFIGTTSEGALKTAHNSVEKTGKGPVFFGPPGNTPQIIQPFLTANIQQKLLTKLSINAVINPLTAIHQIRNGQLLETTYLASLEELCEELDHLMQQPSFLNLHSLALNITTPSTFDLVKKVASATAQNWSSMAQDIRFQRKTEIDFISGYFIKKAEECHFALPGQLNLYHQIKQLESDYLKK